MGGRDQRIKSQKFVYQTGCGSIKRIESKCPFTGSNRRRQMLSQHLITG